MRHSATRLLGLRPTKRLLKVKYPWSTEHADKPAMLAQRPAARTSFPRELHSPNALGWATIDTSFVDTHDVAADVQSDAKVTLEELWDEALRAEAPPEPAAATTTASREEAPVVTVMRNAARAAPVDAKLAAAIVMLQAFDEFLARNANPGVNLTVDKKPRYTDDFGQLRDRRLYFALRQRFVDAAPLLFPPADTDTHMSPELFSTLLQLVTTVEKMHNRDFARVKPMSWEPRRKSDFEAIDFAPAVSSLVTQFQRLRADLPRDEAYLNLVVGLVPLCKAHGSASAIESLVDVDDVCSTLSFCAPTLTADTAIAVLTAIPEAYFTDSLTPNLVEIVRLVVAVRCKNALADATAEDVNVFIAILLKVCNAVRPEVLLPTANGNGTAESHEAVLRAVLAMAAKGILRRFTALLSVAPGREETVMREAGINPMQQYLKVNNVQPFLGKYPPLLHHEAVYKTHAEGLKPAALTAHNTIAFLKLIDELSGKLSHVWKPPTLARVRSETLRRVAQEVAAKRAPVSSALDALAALGTSAKKATPRINKAEVVPMALDGTASTIEIILRSIDSMLGNGGDVLTLANIVVALDALMVHGYRASNVDRLFLQVARFADVMTLDQIVVVVRALSTLQASQASLTILPALANRVETVAAAPASRSASALVEVAVGLAVLNSAHANRVVSIAANALQSDKTVTLLDVIELLQAAADAPLRSQPSAFYRAAALGNTAGQRTSPSTVVESCGPVLHLIPAEVAETHLLAAAVACVSAFAKTAYAAQHEEVARAALEKCDALTESLAQRDLQALPVGGLLRVVVGVSAARPVGDELPPAVAVAVERIAAAVEEQCRVVVADMTTAAPDFGDTATLEVALGFLESPAVLKASPAVLRSTASFAFAVIAHTADASSNSRRSLPETIEADASPQLSKMAAEHRQRMSDAMPGSARAVERFERILAMQPALAEVVVEVRDRSSIGSSVAEGSA